MSAEQDLPAAEEPAPGPDGASARARWRELPERVRPEDAVGTQPVPRAPEVPDAGLAREQQLWGAG